MPDNSQNQASIPEKTNIHPPENVQQPVEAPEAAGKKAAPQPIAPANDQSAIQNLQNNLQGSQAPAQPVTTSNQPVSTKIVKKTKASSEPYIKAAENLIDKDKGDPYKEEEDHKDVQDQYLHDRFGKNIKKS